MTEEQLGFVFDEDPADLPAKFEAFHRDNPRVYRELVRLARQWVDRLGRHKAGIKQLFEVARWQLALATTDADYKINNNYAPFYARLIMRQEADLDDLFDCRASIADEWIEDYCRRTRRPA